MRNYVIKRLSIYYHLFIADSIESLVDKYRGRKLASILADIEMRYDEKLPINFAITYRRHVNELFQLHLQPIAGVPEMLKTLKFPFCIASSAPITKIRKALSVTSLSRYFGDRVFSSYDIGSWKPDPGLFVYAAKKMGFLPEHCVVIEDSVMGVQAGCAAGMTVFGYAHHSDGAALAAAGAKIVFNDMKQLSQLLCPSIKLEF